MERLRQTQRAQNLRLFIDLYATHDLAANGGLHWREIREEYHREQVGQQGPYIIWGFQSIGVNTWPGTAFVRPFMTGEESPYVYGAGHEDGGWPVFWAAWQQLVDLGLVEMIGSLVEDDSEDAALIHPYAIRNGERAERRLAVAAHDAATAMLAPWQAHAADGQHLAPIMRHMPGVQMVGIARLKYRPHTSATQVWIAKMSEWEMLAADYDAIRVDRTGVHCQQVGGNRTTGTHG